MRAAAHVARFRVQRLWETVKAPIWQVAWQDVQRRCGGPDKFPGYDEFLGSAADVYRYLQQELLAANSTRHLQDLCTDDLWPVLRATGTDYERVRRHFGAEECRIMWESTEAFVCSLGPPEDLASAGADLEPTAVAGARFFSVMEMSFAPGQVRHSIDDVIFKSRWDNEHGVKQWKIAYIGGPIGPP